MIPRSIVIYKVSDQVNVLPEQNKLILLYIQKQDIF